MTSTSGSCGRSCTNSSSRKWLLAGPDSECHGWGSSGRFWSGSGWTYGRCATGGRVGWGPTNRGREVWSPFVTGSRVGGLRSPLRSRIFCKETKRMRRYSNTHRPPSFPPEPSSLTPSYENVRIRESEETERGSGGLLECREILSSSKSPPVDIETPFTVESRVSLLL